MLPPIFRPAKEFFVNDSPREVVPQVPGAFRSALQLVLSGTTTKSRPSDTGASSEETRAVDASVVDEYADASSADDRDLAPTWRSEQSAPMANGITDPTATTAASIDVGQSAVSPETPLPLTDTAGTTDDGLVDHALEADDSEQSDSLADGTLPLTSVSDQVTIVPGIGFGFQEEEKASAESGEGDSPSDAFVTCTVQPESTGDESAVHGLSQVTEYATAPDATGRSGGGAASPVEQRVSSSGPLPTPPTPKPPVPNGGLTIPGDLLAPGGNGLRGSEEAGSVAPGAWYAGSAPGAVTGEVAQNVRGDAGVGSSGSAAEFEASGQLLSERTTDGSLISTRGIAVDGAQSPTRPSVSLRNTVREDLSIDASSGWVLRSGPSGEGHPDTGLNATQSSTGTLAVPALHQDPNLEGTEISQSTHAQDAKGLVLSETRATISGTTAHPAGVWPSQFGFRVDDVGLEVSGRALSTPAGTSVATESTADADTNPPASVVNQLQDISGSQESPPRDSYQTGLAKRQAPHGDTTDVRRAGGDALPAEVERSVLDQSVDSLRSALAVEETRRQVESSLRTLLFGRTRVPRLISTERSVVPTASAGHPLNQSENHDNRSDSASQSGEESNPSTWVNPVPKASADGAERGVGTPVTSVRAEPVQEPPVTTKSAEPLPVKEQVENLVPRTRGDTATLRVEDANGKAAHIRVTVRGEQVHTRIVHESQDVAGQLSATSDELHEALTRHGFKDSGLSVKTPRGLSEHNATHTSTRIAPSETGDSADVREDRHHDPRQERREEQRQDRREHARDSRSRRQERSRDESRRHTQ